MSKVEMLIHPDDLEAVAAVLLTFKELRLYRPEENLRVEHFLTIDWSVLNSHLTELANRLQRLFEICALSPVEKSLPPEEIRPTRDVTNLENLLANTEERLLDWQHELAALVPEHEQLRLMQAEIDWLNANHIPWEELLQLELLTLTLGWIPAGQADKMDIPYQHSPLLIMFLSEKEKQVFALAAGVKACDFILTETLATLFFEPLELIKANAMNKVKEKGGLGIESYVREKLRDVEHKQQQIENQRRHFIDIWNAPLISAWQQVQNDLKTLKLIEQYAVPVEYYYYFSGFLPDKKSEQFTLSLKRIVKNSYALFFTDEEKRLK